MISSRRPCSRSSEICAVVPPKRSPTVTLPSARTTRSGSPAPSVSRPPDERHSMTGALGSSGRVWGMRSSSPRSPTDYSPLRPAGSGRRARSRGCDGPARCRPGASARVDAALARERQRQGRAAAACTSRSARRPDAGRARPPRSRRGRRLAPRRRRAALRSPSGFQSKTRCGAARSSSPATSCQPAASARGGGDQDAGLPVPPPARERHALDRREPLVERRRLELARGAHVGRRRVHAGLAARELAQLDRAPGTAPKRSSMRSTRLTCACGERRFEPHAAGRQAMARGRPRSGGCAPRA